MLATTTNLNRFLNKAERIIRNNYNEKGLIVCARIDNVFAINYNGIPFILSVNVAPFNVIVYSIALSSDSKNYIINSRGTCGNQEAVISDIYVDLLHYVRDNNICLETAETTEETAEKQYADYTSEDFCEEDCIENVECANSCSIGYTGRKKEIMTANISDLQHIASNLIAGGWTSKDAKEIQLEYNLCDDEVNAIVEIMEEMWKNRK